MSNLRALQNIDNILSATRKYMFSDSNEHFLPSRYSAGQRTNWNVLDIYELNKLHTVVKYIEEILVNIPSKVIF